MKSPSQFSSSKDIDYFDILSKTESKPQIYKQAKLEFKKKSVIKKKVVDKIIETEADRLRKTEIRAAKTEIYYLRTTGQPQRDEKSDLAMKNRREQLVNCKRVLNSEGYR